MEGDRGGVVCLHCGRAEVDEGVQVRGLQG